MDVLRRLVCGGIVCCMNKKWLNWHIILRLLLAQLVCRGVRTPNHIYEDPGYVLNLMYSSPEWFWELRQFHFETCKRTATLYMCLFTWTETGLLRACMRTTCASRRLGAYAWTNNVFKLVLKHYINVSMAMFWKHRQSYHYLPFILWCFPVSYLIWPYFGPVTSVLVYEWN